MRAGIDRPGWTNDRNVPRRTPPWTMAAPISVIASSTVDPPVVSMSSTQNLTSISGVSGVASSGIGPSVDEQTFDGKAEWVIRRRIGEGSVGTMTV